MKRTDPEVGRTVEENRPVFQCVKTGLLYYYADPPKRYVSVTNVELKTDERKRDK